VVGELLSRPGGELLSRPGGELLSRSGMAGGPVLDEPEAGAANDSRLKLGEQA
jgi:hypothetical protein